MIQQDDTHQFVTDSEKTKISFLVNIEGKGDLLKIVCAGKVSYTGGRSDYYGENRVDGYPFKVSYNSSTKRYIITHNYGKTGHYGFIGQHIRNSSIFCNVYAASITANEAQIQVIDPNLNDMKADFYFIIFRFNE